MFRRPFLVIVRKKVNTPENHEDTEGHSAYNDVHEIPEVRNEQSYYSEKGLSSGYAEYVKVNGLHFNNKLAEYAISKLKNVGPNESHKWTIAQIEKTVNSLLDSKLDFKFKTTYADLAYAANMYYSDFYPQIINPDIACVQAAIAMANDPDGYEGIIFCRWVADVMAKNKSFDWTKFT